MKLVCIVYNIVTIMKTNASANNFTQENLCYVGAQASLRWGKKVCSLSRDTYLGRTHTLGCSKTSVNFSQYKPTSQPETLIPKFSPLQLWLYFLLKFTLICFISVTLLAEKPKLPEKKYYIDTNYIHLPKENMEIINPVKDGMSKYKEETVVLHNSPSYSCMLCC